MACYVRVRTPTDLCISWLHFRLVKSRLLQIRRNHVRHAHRLGPLLHSDLIKRVHVGYLVGDGDSAWVGIVEGFESGRLIYTFEVQVEV